MCTLSRILGIDVLQHADSSQTDRQGSYTVQYYILSRTVAMGFKTPSHYSI